MTLMLQVELTFALLLAAFLSAIIGMNRERHERPAGLRTHMLVGIGSCLFTLLSIHGFGGGDPGRVAAQILTGIGFIGAGAIIKDGNEVTGLTTAASIWAMAAIGMAVALNAWFLALVATLLVWCVLSMMRWFEKKDASD